MSAGSCPAFTSCDAVTHGPRLPAASRVPKPKPCSAGTLAMATYSRVMAEGGSGREDVGTAGAAAWGRVASGPNQPFSPPAFRSPSLSLELMRR